MEYLEFKFKIITVSYKWSTTYIRIVVNKLFKYINQSYL